MVISKALPGLSTNPATDGLSTTDFASLSGGFNPTGTITFNLYAVPNCSGTPVSSGSVTVFGDGTYASPQVTPSQAGIYWWTAAYSGDAANEAVTSPCSAGQVVIGP